MNSPQLNTGKIIKHWVDTSDDDFNTMHVLYDSRIYHWSLFMGHISLEKLLKPYFVKTHGEHAPFTHNLFRLSELGGLEINEEYEEWLFRITTFNLNARYDDYKKEFYNMCTANFASEWIEKIKTLRQWIKQKL